MTAISSTTGTSATSSTSATTANPYGTLNANDFLKLLTTQMQNQDPTAPVDNSQMVADMAQFTNVANTGSMNTTLSTISTQLNSIGTALGVGTISSTGSNSTTA